MIDSPDRLTALIQTLYDADEAQRARAARDLRALGAGALEALAEVAAGRTEPPRPKRTTGLLGLGPAPDPRRLSALARGEAVALLEVIDDPRAAEALAEVAGRAEHDQLRCAAALALARRRDARAVPFLIQGLTCHDAELRGDAAEALGEMGDPRAVEPLIQTMRMDGQPAPRWKAMTALGRLGDPRAVKALTDQLAGLLELPAADWAPPTANDYGDQPRQLIWTTCMHALEALERLGDPRALPFLERLAHEAPARTVGSRAWHVAEHLRQQNPPA
ncbi:MAG: HEAT repeat domain-containing protein [Anaerolineales bacterium]|nr:HEAT repeat domain-containing protein [Anaerolineales bacterium]